MALLLINKSQSAREKNSSGVLEILIIDLHDIVLVQFFFLHEEN